MPRYGKTAGRGYGTRYRQVRAAILAGNPKCYWCGGKHGPAVTADHEPPIAMVGRPHLNLVPACRHCNFGRGNSSRGATSSSRDW